MEKMMVGKADTKNKKFQETGFYFLLLASCFLPLKKKAQTILEYTIVLGVIVLVMFAMGPMIKRGTQSLIKVVADQIGVQQNAEQRFDETGHLEKSFTAASGSMDKQVQDFGGMTTYIFNDLTDTRSSASINLGFTEDQ